MDLAEHFDCPWVPQYGTERFRQKLETRPEPWR
jgi:hypothetical protein